MMVSVIIPTFNRVSLLPRAVASVFAQGVPGLDIVVIDDGSTDDTAAVMRALPVQSIRQQNAGDAAARNTGLRAATGDWIAFLDDDDTWRPDKLKRQLEVLEQSGADACCGLVAMEHASKPRTAARLLSGSAGPAFLRGEQSAAITSLLVRADVVRQVGEFDTSLRIGSDMEWIARLAHVARFCAVPEVVADYNHSEDGLSRFTGIEQLIDRDQYDLMTVDRVRARCRALPTFELAAWARFAARVVDRCARHLMYAGRLAEADELIANHHLEGADEAILARTERKLRKAKLLALVGRRLKHPKFGHVNDICG